MKQLLKTLRSFLVDAIQGLQNPDLNRQVTLEREIISLFQILETKRRAPLLAKITSLYIEPYGTEKPLLRRSICTQGQSCYPNCSENSESPCHRGNFGPSKRETIIRFSRITPKI